MSQSTPVVVREVGGATLATLPYPPWPVDYQPAPVQGYTLASGASRPAGYVVYLAWGYLPVTLDATLRSLPRDRQTEWYLPLPGQQSGGLLVYGWVRGTLVEPDRQPSWKRDAWRGVTWRLVGATVV